MMASIGLRWLRERVAMTPSPVMNSPAVGAMWELLHDRAPGFARVKDGVETTEIVLPRRGLLHDEASSFLRAVETGIAVVDEAGYVTLPTVMPKSPPGRYALFSRSETSMSINLEYIVQVGATAELLLNQGHQANRLGFERGEF